MSRSTFENDINISNAYRQVRFRPGAPSFAAGLANAPDWTAYREFLAEGRAAIVQGKGPNLADYDPDTIMDADWGGFNALNAAAVA
jgi:hypothetical protein